MNSFSFWTEPNTKHAFQLSCISLLLTVLAIVAGVALFVSTGSSLFLVLGLENCVDFLSSVVVLWRFFAPSKNITAELEAKLKNREKRASVAISIILVGLGISVWITASQDLLRGQEDPSDENAALAISFVSILLFGALSWAKFRYARALESPSLYKDGICSMIGTILSASLFVNTLIIKEDPGAWWIDPVVAIACGLASFVYGLRALFVARVKDNLQICSLRWWFLSHGDTDEDKREDKNYEEPQKIEMTTDPTIVEELDGQEDHHVV